MENTTTKITPLLRLMVVDEDIVRQKTVPSMQKTILKCFCKDWTPLHNYKDKESRLKKNCNSLSFQPLMLSLSSEKVQKLPDL